MNKLPTLLAWLFLPALLIVAGIYFKQDILISIGCVFLIFYIIMLLRNKLSSNRSKDDAP